ncbi:MAG: hypothetical protein AAF380_03175 [Bacteroidota bacterium]
MITKSTINIAFIRLFFFIGFIILLFKPVYAAAEANTNKAKSSAAKPTANQYSNQAITGVDEEKSSVNSDKEKEEKGIILFEEYVLQLYRRIAYMEKDVKEPIVLVIGITGAGKSTTICHLMDIPLYKEEVKERKPSFLSDENEDTQEDDNGISKATKGIDLDPNYPAPDFPYPKIGHNAAVSETIMPGIFHNPSQESPLYYCDMPGFADKRGEAEKEIAALAPTMLLQSAPKGIKAVLIIMDYHTIKSGRSGANFIQTIQDVMSHFRYGQWNVIKNSLFLGITQCKGIEDQKIKGVFKDQIIALYDELPEKEKLAQAAEKKLAEFQKKQALNKQEISSCSKSIAEYMLCKEQEKFFEIFTEVDQTQQPIKITFKEIKLLFIRPLHKYQTDYKKRVIEVLKRSNPLDKNTLADCSYSNGTLLNSFGQLVNRMDNFFTGLKREKAQCLALQQSLSNTKNIPKQISDLDKSCKAINKKIQEIQNNTDLINVYAPNSYHRHFTEEEIRKNYVRGIGGALFGAVLAGTGAWALYTVAATATAVVSGVVGGTAATGAVIGGADGAIDENKSAVKGALEGLASLGRKIPAFIKNIDHNVRPYKEYAYMTINEPIYQIKVTFGPGLFEKKEPTKPLFKLETNKNIQTFTIPLGKHTLPTRYKFIYIGHFHTDGYIKLSMSSRYNELSTTKNKIKNWKKDIATKKETKKSLIAADRASKEAQITQNKKEIEALNMAIRDTYPSREKPRKNLVDSKDKCKMLTFFATKPLFAGDKHQVIAQEEKNEDEEKDDEKSYEGQQNPLVKAINNCVKNWRIWLEEQEKKTEKPLDHPFIEDTLQ